MAGSSGGLVGRAARRPLLAVVDRSAATLHPVVGGYVAGLRRKHPQATPEAVVRMLTQRYLATVTGAGAAIGGAAAVPVVGTVAALGLGAGEVVAFVEASAIYTLAVASVHGIELDDAPRRRALLLAVLAGENGAAIMQKAAGRGEAAWAQLLPRGIPRSAVEQANRALTRWAVRRFGARQGAALFGRLAPFGIGAVIGGAANAATGRGVVAAVRQAFGPPPTRFPDDPLTPPALPTQQQG